MKHLRKIIPALAVAVMCFSCNKSKIKITLNAGVGIYSNYSFSKTIIIDRGTSLSNIVYEKPVYVDLYNEQQLEKVNVVYWADANGNKYQNSIITSDTTLYAHYAESINDERMLALEEVYRTRDFVVAIKSSDADYMKIFNGELAYVKDIINNSNSCYELFTVTKIFDSIVRASAQPPSIENVKKIFKFERDVFNLVKKVNTDQRCIPYGKMAIGIAATFVMKPEILDYGMKFTDLMDKNIDTINPDFAYYYGIPTDGFVRAVGQQEAAKEPFLQMHEMYIKGCINSSEIGQVYAITKPLVGISSMAVMRPELLDTYAKEYKQFVKDITGASL